MNTQTVILDVDKRYDPSQVVTIGQGDKSGTTIVAEVYDKGVSVSLSGYTAEFEMRLPDGRNYVRDDDCTVSGNTITYVVDEEHCGAAAGHTNECYFNIKSGSSVIYSTSRFRMDVLRAAHDGAVPSESWDSAIEEAIENANEAAEEAREAAGGVTPLMSTILRGGAKLGDGLALTGEALGVDPLTTTDVDTVASDGSLTSSKALTGTMLTYLWSKIKAKFASLVNGAVAISQGGTGATTAALARTNLEVVKDSAIAYVESTTATANHAIGDYFMLGDVLMKATAAIAAGETISTSNATPATVQGQIDTLRDSVVTRGSGMSTASISNDAEGRLMNLQLVGNGKSSVLYAKDDGLGLWNGAGNYLHWYLYRSMGSTSVDQNASVSKFAFQTTNQNAGSPSSRVPILFVVANQGAAPTLIYVTVKADGTGYASASGVSIENGVITLGSGGWAVTTAFYDPRKVTVTSAD